MNRFICFTGIVLLMTGTALTANAAQDAPEQPSAANLTGLHDFDFLFGEWRIHSRRLKTRLAGGNDWEEFEGSLASRSYMDGWANVDDTVFHTPEGPYRGVAPRA